jgi:hypothetical protein
MTVIVGTAFVIAGIAAGVRWGILDSRAAANQHIPMWRTIEGYRRPRRGILWQVVGALLAAIGAFLLLMEWDFAVIFLMLLPQLAALCVAAWHNRSVANRKLTQ